MSKLNLYYSDLRKVLAGQPKKNESDDVHKLVDVTEDFKRCVARYCTEEIIFEVDGMQFKATCERID